MAVCALKHIFTPTTPALCQRMFLTSLPLPSNLAGNVFTLNPDGLPVRRKRNSGTTNSDTPRRLISQELLKSRIKLVPTSKERHKVIGCGVLFMIEPGDNEELSR